MAMNPKLSDGAEVVAGPAADDAAASGNPVPVGGIYNTTPPTYSNLDRTQLQSDSRGSLAVRLYGNNLAEAVVTNNSTDGISAQTTLYVNDHGHTWNGSTYDRGPRSIVNATDSIGTGIAAAGMLGQYDDTAPSAVTENQFANVRISSERGLYQAVNNGSALEGPYNNRDVTVFASAARTATPTPFDGTNNSGKSLHLVIDCTVDPASASVTFTIQGKDAVSGKFYTILASAAITAVGTTVLRVGPGLTAAANLVANDILPRTWRVIATHVDADSITYSVGASIVNG